MVNPDVYKVLKKDPTILDSIELFLGKEHSPLVVTKDLIEFSENGNSVSINWLDFEKARVLYEKKKDVKVYKTFLDILNYGEKKEKFDRLLEEVSKPVKAIELEEEKSECVESSVIVLKQYKDEIKEREVQDFVQYYKIRYGFLSKILKQRIELKDVISINRLKNKFEKDKVSLIGLVSKIEKTKNNNVMVTLEDFTGIIKVLINNNKKELYDLAQYLVHDEVIGITGNIGNNIVFVNELFYPDVPIGESIKKCDDDVHAVFISDFHVGSKYFLEEPLFRFIRWINMETGTHEQKEVAKKIKYLIIAGDLVEGIGIYPGQMDDLIISDIYDQYNKFAEYIKLIRKDIQIIVCPGNHDASRLAEPQPLLDKEMTKSLWEIPNVTVVTNPSWVNIHSSKDFSGFDVLIYHGFSYDYYADKVEAIRLQCPEVSKRYEQVMKLLLKKRHLAPSHESTLTIPDPKQDFLIIEKVPDFFISGHVHNVSVLQYGKTTNIISGSWISQTPYQDKFGHVCQPGRVPVVNLKTREAKVMKFV
ncbi:MAG: DNA-directed DNA polymerase II small subunit [Candidatus Woesearchaeota archaeon]